MKIVEDKSSLNVLSQVEGRVVTAYRIPTTIKDPLSFLNTLTELDYNNESIYDIMLTCAKIHKLDAISGTCIDVMNNFATTNLRVEPTGNKKLDQIIQDFCDNVNTGSGTEPGIYHLMQRMGLGFLVSGNIFPLKTYQLVGDSVWPTRVTLLNPERIFIDKTIGQFGPKPILYRVNDDLAKLINKDARKDKNTKNIPSIIRRKYKRSLKDLGFRFNAHITLDPQLVTHIKRKAMDYEDWGTPYLTRTFKPLSIISKLQRLDDATLEGMINLITVFKIGSDIFPADQGRLDKFAALLKQQNGVDPNKYLVWAHDISIEQVGPDGKILSFDKRYDQAIAQLKYALGAVDPLIGGKPTSNVWDSFIALLETLQAMRKSLTVWLEDTVMQIADQNNIVLKKRPVIVWDRMNLTNEYEMKNLILAFYDRGLIDPRTALMESGRDPEIIIENKKDIKEKGEDELFIHPKLPFSNDPSTDQGKPKDGDVKKKVKEKTFDSTKTSGPSSKSEILDGAENDIFDEVFSIMSNYLYTNRMEDKEKLISYIIGQSQRLLDLIHGVNESLGYYGISTNCRKVLEKERDQFLVELKNYPTISMEKVIEKLDNFKSNLLISLSNIRKIRV